jgi:hypothetical protein
MSPNVLIVGSNRHVFVRVSERMISACVLLTVKHGGRGVMVWGCFAGDTVCDLEFMAHLTSMPTSILQQYAIPSGLRLVGLHIVGLS